MRTTGILIAALAAFALRTEAQEVPRPAALDSVDVESIAAVASLFRESHDSVWPGFDLSSQPLLVYRPGQWAIVLNPPEDVAGYGPYPASWPPLGAPALLHSGAIGGLVGQLEFDYQVGSTTTVAIPIADNLPGQPQPRVRALFGFVVHEAFHQFQRSAFRGVDEPSEERYPILDRQNNARAALEMRILEDAVRAVERLDSAGARRLAGMFIAQRRFRWEQAPRLVREFERAKELTEGTAKYVESRLIADMAVRCRAGSVTGQYVCQSLQSVTAASYLQEDFDSRLVDGALSPGDVPRNRIYPAGAAIGVLLDFFGVDWKHAAASLPDSSSLADLLAASLSMQDARFASLRTEADRRYGLPGIQRRSQRLIDAYVREAAAAVRAFEAQPGYRVEVQLPAAGTSRSRSSTGKRWVMDAGRRVFGAEFLAYTLRRPGQAVFLAVERRPVLDDLVAEGERRVTFYVPSVDSIRVDGAPGAFTPTDARRFDDLLIRGAGFSLEARVPGTLTLSANRIAVRLAPRAP